MRHSVRAPHPAPDGRRVIFRVAAGRMVDVDPVLEAFIPQIPRLDPTDPVSARKIYAALAAARPAPDTAGMEVEDRTVAADPDVPVRI